jgi:hypothetical protein
MQEGACQCGPAAAVWLCLWRKRKKKKFHSCYLWCTAGTSAAAAAATAAVSAAVSAAEDPEKLLDQVVNEMQEDLIKMRQASAQVRRDMCCTYYLICCFYQSAAPTTLWKLHATLCAMLCAMQVMASQKQMEAKFKQAQATAVRIFTHRPVPFATGGSSIAGTTHGTVIE